MIVSAVSALVTSTIHRAYCSRNHNTNALTIQADIGGAVTIANSGRYRKFIAPDTAKNSHKRAKTAKNRQRDETFSSRTLSNCTCVYHIGDIKKGEPRSCSASFPYRPDAFEVTTPLPKTAYHNEKPGWKRCIATISTISPTYCFYLYTAFSSRRFGRRRGRRQDWLLRRDCAGIGVRLIGAYEQREREDEAQADHHAPYVLLPDTPRHARPRIPAKIAPAAIRAHTRQSTRPLNTKMMAAMPLMNRVKMFFTPFI